MNRNPIKPNEIVISKCKLTFYGSFYLRLQRIVNRLLSICILINVDNLTYVLILSIRKKITALEIIWIYMYLLGKPVMVNLDVVNWLQPLCNTK